MLNQGMFHLEYLLNSLDIKFLPNTIVMKLLLSKEQMYIVNCVLCKFTLLQKVHIKSIVKCN